MHLTLYITSLLRRQGIKFLWSTYLVIPLLHDTTGNRLSNRLYNWLSNWFANRFDNRLYHVYKHWNRLPGWQPVGCLYTRYNLLSMFDNRLYRVNINRAYHTCECPLCVGWLETEQRHCADQPLEGSSTASICRTTSQYCRSGQSPAGTFVRQHIISLHRCGGTPCLKLRRRRRSTSWWKTQVLKLLLAVKHL